MTSNTSRWLRFLAQLPFVTASGMLIGFCLGGVYGRLFGSHAGHGLADLAYLFAGALLGGCFGLFGLGAALWRTRPQDEGLQASRDWPITAGAIASAGVIGLLTFALSSRIGW